MSKSSLQSPKNEQILAEDLFSPYDTLENLNYQAQKILSLIDKFSNPKESVNKLIEEVKLQISSLLQS